VTPAGVRLYTLLLRLFPAEFRTRHQEEMVRVFRQMWMERRSPLSRLRLLMAAAWDAGREARTRHRVARTASTTGGDGDRNRGKGSRQNHMGDFIQDLSYTLRQLVARPSFSAILLLTLTVGIGATTAVFSVVEGVLLRPLPFPEPDRLTVVWTQFPSMDLMEFPASWPEYEDYRSQSSSYEEMGLWGTTERTLTGETDPERLDVAYFTWTMFPVLEVEPRLGRVFTADEDRDGYDGVVVLSYGLWERRFASDPGIVGQSIQMDGNAVTVLGVMPWGFDFPNSDVDAWIPVGIDPTNPPGRASHFGRILGRLAPGITLTQAKAELRGLTQRWQDDESLEHTWHLDFHPAFLRPLHQEMVGDIQTALIVLLGAVGIVLLIACVNVANLLLVRGEGRMKEISIRAAVGAGRGRIIRQLMTESLVTALLGGAAGLGLAYAGVKGLLALAPPGLPRANEIGLDPAVMAFAASVTIFSGLFFGLAPAFQMLRMDVQGNLRDEGRGGTVGVRRFRARQLLVVGQTALAVVLLIGAGLLLQSFVRLRSVDPGFSSDDVLAFNLSLPNSIYPENQTVTGFYRELIPRLESLPGVEEAGLVFTPPLTGSLPPNDIEIENRSVTEEDGPPLNADIQMVSAGYFDIMRIPLLQGRVFDQTDREDSEAVAVVDDVLARRFWENPSDALGERIRQPGTEWARIVGIVGGVRQEDLSQEPRGQLYLLHAQTGRVWSTRRAMTVLLRTGVTPTSLVPGVRRQVKAMDPNLPVYAVTTMERNLAESTARERFTMFLQLLFAGVALLLAVVGIYGVLSYSVAQRAREIGIRMALGAERGGIVRLVVRQGMVLVGIALTLGLLGALATGSVLASLLYQVSPRDPITYGAVTLTLGLAALLACWFPARRASAVDPQAALRSE